MDPTAVSAHYNRANLLDAIEAGVHQLGKTTATVTIDELAPVDEFHIGGRQASVAFFDQLNFTADHHLLDVGCGLGGPARFVANHSGSRITGIDLTPEYVATGNALCRWVNVHEQVQLQTGNALSIPAADATFDGGYMMHVGMNIDDKRSLYTEIHRVLRLGATFGIYDIMRIGDGELAYPMPWATDAAMSFVGTPAEYQQAVQDAGFTVVAARNRHAFALEFFQAARARQAQLPGPPPLGLHVLMGESTGTKLGNMVGGIVAGHIAPVELIVKKKME